MPTSRGITRLADIPDGERRDGGPELVMRGEHPVIPVPVLPRRRHEVSETVTQIAAFGSTILSGVIQDGIVRIKIHAIGYRCESVTEGANEFVWRPVSLVGNSRVQPLLQTTSGKYHKLVFENPRNALFEAPVDKFFNSTDLEAFLSGANLGRKHFDIVYIARDENGRIKNNYVPASRRYIYELVPSNSGTFELKISLTEK